MPKYDQVQVQEDDGAVLRDALSSNVRQIGQGTDLMKAIQKALSATRKADQRARRLTQEKKQKEAQWRQYGREMKESYERESRKYHQDILRLDAELEDVLQNGHEAAETVKKLAAHGLSAQQTDAPMEDMSHGAGWEALLASSQEPPELDDNFLREALQAANRAAPSSAYSDPWLQGGDYGRHTSEVRTLFQQTRVAAPSPGADGSLALDHQPRVMVP